MICVLIGVVPASLLETWESILQKHANTNTKHGDIIASIEWRDYSIAIDEGKPTLIIEALTGEKTTPEMIMTEVETRLKQELILCDDNDAECNNITITCEVWATAPAPLPLKPLKGYDEILKYENKVSNDKSSWVHWSATIMKKWGILIQSKILNPNQVSTLSLLVTKTIKDTENLLQIHRPDITIGKDFFCFQEIASRNRERFDLRLTDENTIQFVEKYILGHSNVNSFLQSSLGPLNEIDFDVSVVYSNPGACIQGWHADGSHQKGAKDAGFVHDGWKTQLAGAYAICLFIPLINLNDQVGYTQFWPGSHQSKDFVGFGPVAEITGSTFDGICNAGDGVWYDYRLLHRGMQNTSCVIRPVLQVIFKKKWYIERANYGDESIIKNLMNIRNLMIG